MAVLITANVAAALLETVAPIHQPHRDAFRLFEIVSVAIFTAEYVVRLWVCREHPPLARRGPIRARLQFAISPFALIDLLAILPFYLSLLVPLIDLRLLRVFRLLRLLKLARYSPALASLGRVLYDERRALGATLLVMTALLMMASTAAYYAERHSQPEAFGSIPAAMWWGLATLTTVGYGDAVPVTAIGKLLGGLMMIFGLGMFALPIAIISSGFANEIHRRDFVVSWGMVARVPVFAELNAVRISRIARLLRGRSVQADTVILRAGEPADAMYFIASGEVEVDIEPEKIRLHEGDFFGEIGLLHGVERTATVRALSRCNLLVLDARDFEDLVQADPELHQAIGATAEERLAALKQ